MRVTQKCDDEIPTAPLTPALLTVGTVFSISELRNSFYLKLSKGFVNLADNSYFGLDGFSKAVVIFKVFPNARVVLE